MPRARLARLSARERRTLVVVGVALLVSLTGFSANPVRAADAAGAPLTADGAADRLRRFSIPAQPLADAIAAFTRQTGIAVRVDPVVLAGLRSVALDGSYRPLEALKRLLGSAPLVAGLGDGAGLAVNGQQLKTIGSVSIIHTLYVTATPAYGKLLQPLVDTPQTIVEVPQAVLKEQNATSLHDALRNVSGISLAAGEGGSQGDALTIRGFDAKDDIYLDGMRDFGNYYRDPFDLERVEVIMGPNSMLAGHGEGGGLVNQVSRLPRLGSFTDATFTDGSANENRLQIDANRQLGTQSALRIDAVAMDGGTADRDVTFNKRLGLAGAYTVGLGTPTRLTFSFLAQNDDGIPDYGIPYVNDRPANVDRSNFYGFANGDRIEDNIAVYTAALDHEYGNGTTLHSQLRFASYARDFDASNATQPTPQPIPGTPANLITVPRAQHHRNGVETFLENQTYFKGQSGSEGGVQQHWIAGIEATRETSHETSFSATGLPTTNLADPNPYVTETYLTNVAKSDNHVAADTLAAFVADSISFDRHWELDAGARADTFDAENTEYVSKTAAAQDVRRISPQASLVYKPATNSSVYLSYDTSFQPSADALSLTSAQLVAPATNTTFELGSKWLLHDGRTTLSASIFNSVMSDAHITEPDGTVEPIGTERSQGFQLQLQGRLARHLEISGGYTLLETRVLSYALATQPGVVGTRIPNAPTGSASMWTTYEMPRFKVGLGGSGLSQRQASIGVDTATGVPILVPGYVRLDGLLSYKLSNDTSISLNAYNLLNKYYLDEIHPDHVVPGAGRSIAVNVNMHTGK